MALSTSIRRVIAPLLTIALLGGVGWGVWSSYQDKQLQNQNGLASNAQVVIKGISGSEKIPFLSDPRVVEYLAKKGIQLQVQKAGSREIAQRTDLKQFDFAYPAGAAASTKLQREQKTKQTHPTFFTPMAIATWKPIVELLAANGIVEKRGNAWFISDIHKLMAWMNEGKRWQEIPNNKQYPVGKSILIATTDIRTSNSAAMYLALMSYLLNERNVVQDEAQIANVTQKLAPLFLKQGYQESSSAGPFEDYIAMGMGKAPLVLVYESQFIEHLAKTQNRNADMVLLYPAPTIYTKHVLVPFTEQGKMLGELLETDETLQKLAAEYGYRVNNPAIFRDVNTARHIDVPETLLDVIDPPAYEVLEKMISNLEQQMNH